MMRILLLTTILLFATSCSKKEKKGPPATPASTVQTPAPPVAPPFVPPAPPTQENAPIAHYPSSITVELTEAQPSFGEPVTILFNRAGRILSRHLYTFNKSYLGPVDNSSLFWWRQGDDIIWNTPYAIISLDLSTMKVLGGTEGGSGSEIGKVRYDGHKFSIELSVQFQADKEKQIITVFEASNPVPAVTSCPPAARLISLCELYTGIYGALSSIDFRAFGEVGPQVAKEVMSVSTVLNLARSVWSFSPDVEQVRAKYLVPMLKAIGQIKALRRMDPGNREPYLRKTKDVYTNLTVTSIDTVFKSQKMMPEMTFSAGKTGFASVLAYIGLNGTADKLISSKQPPWFKELVAPIIRESGVVMVDILTNGQMTMDQRVARFLAMENQLKDAVRRICQASPSSAQNECREALNQ